MTSSDSKYQEGDPPEPIGVGADVIVSPDTRRENRIPPGQSRTKKWPVLDAFGPPRIDLSSWSLEVFGLVRKRLTFNLDEFRSLPRVKVFADFHCVTHWSRLGNLWEGVAAQELLRMAGVDSRAKYVVCHAYDYSWSTNLPLSEFDVPDALLADTHDSEPISLEHGGPVRGMVPRLYAWKSAKWIKSIELVEHDQPGYWERGGYHNHGDPWKEERFWEGTETGI